MSAPVASLGDAIQTIRANPQFVAIAAVVLLAGIIASTLTSLIPLIQFISTAIVGTVGAAVVGAIAIGTRDSPSGTVELDGIKSTLETDGKTLFLTYLSVSVITLVATIGTILVTLAVVTVAPLSADMAATQLPTSPTAASTPPPDVGLVGVGLILVIPALILSLALPAQFLNVAVVMGNHSVTGAFREAIEVTIDHPISVFGYTILRGLVIAVLFLLFISVVGIGSVLNERFGLGLAVALTPILTAGGAVLYYSHHVHYYRRLRNPQESTQTTQTASPNSEGETDADSHSV